MAEKFSRRCVLSAGFGAVAGAVLEPALGFETPSLDALARAKGMRFGSEIDTDELGDARYRAITLAECGIVVPGNALKWPEIEPRPGVFTFADGDRIAQFAHRNGLLLRGHNLFWPRDKCIPDWLTGQNFGSRAAIKRVLTAHIAKECAHYPQIHSWDVVNEAIDRKTGALRQDVVTEAMGLDAIDFCFHAARQAAPKAQLVYNDYMSWEFVSTEHRAGVLKLLEGFKKRGVPVDALGLQSHLGPHPKDLTHQGLSERTAAWRAFLDEVTAMGYALLVTELTYHNQFLTGDAASRDRIAAEEMRAYLDVTLGYKQVGQVLVWGMADKYSWMDDPIKRGDPLVNRPAPYGRDYRPKPLRDAIAAAFRAAPVRG
jgi:endo-1,4-beta-xylanase